MWFDNESETTTSTLTAHFSSNFPFQPPTDKAISDRDNDILREVVIYTGSSDRCNVKWDNSSLGFISLYLRGRLIQIKARLNHYRKMEFITSLCLFKPF